jgi:molecular chaperone DnaJ
VSAAKRDFYEVLGVGREADAGELKRAYRKLAMLYHPDRNPNDPAAEDRFKEATEAYTVLSDPEKRRRYDRLGHAAFGGPGQGFEAVDFGSVTEILEGLFGEMFGGRRRPRRRVGRDLTYELTISFADAALGAEKVITMQRPGPCGTCQGSGAAPGTQPVPCAVCGGRGEVRLQRGFFGVARPCTACQGRGERVESPCRDCHGTGQTTQEAELQLKIPAGVENGAVRTVRGGGEIAPGGAGDLHVTVRVEEHPLFTREGADILCTVPVSFPQATLGTTLEVPTLEGRVNMKLPPGTQSGKVFRIRGKGIPVFGGAGKGDQLVTIVVEVPSRITRKQRKLITELAEEMGIDTHPQQAGFLDKLRSLFE